MLTRRTRIVRWLRVVLPLLALAILSTMFLFSRDSGVEPQIPYADVDAEDMARDPRIVSPEYAGVTADGAEMTLRAAEAAPARQGDGGQAQRVMMNWRSPDGLVVDLSAPTAGVLGGIIALDGGVRMSTSSGWSVEAARIEAATDRAQILAPAGVSARAPFGELTAGGMELHPRTADGLDGENRPGSATLNFTGGVRLIYRP